MLDLGAEGARLPGTDDLQAGIMIEGSSLVHLDVVVVR